MKKTMLFLFLILSLFCFLPNAEAKSVDSDNFYISSISDFINWSNENGEIKTAGFDVEKNCYISTSKKKINFSLPTFMPDFFKYKRVIYLYHSILKNINLRNDVLFNIFSRLNASPRAP